MDLISQLKEQVNLTSTDLLKAFKKLEQQHQQLIALVAALLISEGDEEAQLKRIAELQAENDAIGQELQKLLEFAEKELNQIQELFIQASDIYLNLKKPDVN
ncbi:mediator of RNA polymerase II transcription subunit 21-like [Lotus japonicus]|uniref:mediator of RNA polymerase II transcription subunit 21-like n=1 Tax=Lotus japonicus TaxID=34305 RepID=UPI0025884F6B|nr:mediator of RNA polymerase II transcription subunit 21-like [Lotus japonicus]XP_057455156.1 mediator of RNA polymerase II transcription subunit 21-like [Lotus japonicus]